MKYYGLSIAKIALFRVESHLRTAKYFFKHVLPNRSWLEKTKELRMANSDRCAFVFANGPSLLKLDPRKIAFLQKEQGFHVFALSSYINTEFGKIVRPDYYVLSDPAHFGYFHDSIPGKRLAEVKNDMQSIVNNKIPLFMPLQYVRKTDYDNIYPFSDAENFFSDNVSDITMPRGFLAMTAYKALSIACYMGYEKIYICGVDNNFFKSVTVDENNVMYYDIQHYYESATDPGVRHKVRAFEGETIGELLYDLHFLFKHLEKFRHFPIVNLDKDGLVDCFSKQHELDVYK